ncbi:MAG TPA: hypothetical protein VKT49_02320, partial [Bryobacteraceae bacterium]|nr:hypothetical protein [Bryobacteraceae bacterium]
NSSISGAGACYLYFYSHVLYLAADGQSPQTSLAIGTPGTLQNSQCSINVGASSAVYSGNTLTLNLAITFSQSFAGTRNIYLLVENTSTVTKWMTAGTWTVP